MSSTGALVSQDGEVTVLFTALGTKGLVTVANRCSARSTAATTITWTSTRLPALLRRAWLGPLGPPMWRGMLWMDAFGKRQPQHLVLKCPIHT